MIVIISAQQPGLDSPVEYRFGRSTWLIRVDTKSNQWKAFPNPGASQSGGAGVAAAQFVIDQKAESVISGDFGPNAASAFRAAHISMHRCSNDNTTVRQAVDHLLLGNLPAVE